MLQFEPFASPSLKKTRNIWIGLVSLKWRQKSKNWLSNSFRTLGVVVTLLFQYFMSEPIADSGSFSTNKADRHRRRPHHQHKLESEAAGFPPNSTFSILFPL